MFGRICAGFPVMHGWGGIGMGIILLVIAVLVIVLLVRLLETNRVNRGSPETAIEILEKRYAKGEITKDEFDKVKKDLTK